MSIRRFVVLTLPRTGSNHLCGLLDSHPDVLCHLELFNPPKIWFSFAFAHKDAPDWTDTRRRDADPLGFLERIWRLPQGASWIGFKFFLDHDPRVLDAILADPAIAVVLLRRQNLLRVWSSWEIARRTQLWDNLHGQKHSGPPLRVPFVLDGFLDYLQRTRAAERAVRQRLVMADRPALDITYEALDGGTALDDVRAFLGLDPGPRLTSPFHRQNAGRVADRFIDPDAVARTLRGSSMAWMLDEVVA